MFPKRLKTSEFTVRAFDGNVKALEEATGWSKTELYAIQAGERPDHLLYAKELHKGLCVCNPEAAKEYRESLESDAALVSPKRGAKIEQPDDLTTKKYCDKLTTALLGSEEDKEDAMRRLHEHLTGRLRRRVYSPAAHLRDAG